MTQPRRIRLSDDERAQAMSALSRALADGRLSITEYDERCRQAGAASFAEELEPLFVDLPTPTSTTDPASSPSLPPVPERTPGIYYAEEIEAVCESSRHPRQAAMTLGAIISITGMAAFPTMYANEFMAAAPAWTFFTLSLLIVPVMLVMIYGFKVGPKDWHTPSPAKLERNRTKQIEAEHRRRVAELEAAERARAIEMRAAKKQRNEELRSQAIDYAKRFIPQPGDGDRKKNR